MAVVTNIAADHLGLQGIDTLEQLARVKAVVPNSVLPGGYSILNADDDLVYQMRENLDCNIALFSMDENSARIKEHCDKNGIACVYEQGYITILKGSWKIRVDKVSNVPITFGGKAEFNIQNALAAVLAAYLSDFKIEDIKQALETFVPSPAQTPGRMNMFQFKNFSVLIDYAHNAHGMQAIGKYLGKIDATSKVGIVAGVGDRRDDDTIQLGEEAAKVFDEIIIRQDKNLRGKADDEIIRLITTGIKNVDPNKKITVLKKESEAIDYAIKHAVKGIVQLTIISDVVPDALEQVMKYREEEEKLPIRTEA